MDFLSLVTDGLATVLSDPSTLLWCLIGVFVGTVVGALPGVGTPTAMAVLLPLTFGLEPLSALTLLVSIYLGGMYGGRISSILLNIPGDASAVVSTFDGHPLARQGKVGYAMTLSAVASFIGGIIGFIGLAALSQTLADVAIEFGPAHYFLLIVLVLLMTSGISNARPLRSLIAVVLGLLISTVGMDPVTGDERFTWGLIDLWDGVPLAVVAIGVFGISELLMRLDGRDEPATVGGVQKLTLRALFPSPRSLARYSPSMARGGLVGFVIGLFPGAGASMATFVAYATEKVFARDTSRFGKGDPRGLAAPEAADNGSVGGALIPTLALGIPGSAAGALILGGLVMAGLQPGPQLFTASADIVWPLIAAVLVANVLLLVLNTVMIPMFAAGLNVVLPLLTPVITALCFVGVFSARGSLFDVGVMVLLGLLGYGMRLGGYPVANLLLGVILGPILEDNFRKALLSSQGRYDTFWDGPLAIGLITAIITAVTLTTVFKIRSGRSLHAVASLRTPSYAPDSADTDAPAGR